MSQVTSISQLVVEGKDDLPVISALCKAYNLPNGFGIEIANNTDELEGGINELLNSLTVRIKMRGLQNLGVVIDADTDTISRWQSVCGHLNKAGYVNLPDQPDKEGTIIQQEELPRFGVWIMPDNQLPGMLENFVAYLIPPNDLLAPKAKQIIGEIEGEGLNRYTQVHHPKAFIHTWLAWQDKPGRPMGQSITAHVLHPQQLLAQTFVSWLNRLFLGQ